MQIYFVKLNFYFFDQNFRRGLKSFSGGRGDCFTSPVAGSQVLGNR